jgi:TPR repeat protein
VSPRVIRVDNGSVIYSQTITSQGEYTICEGQLQKASVSTTGAGETTVNTNAVSTPEGLIGTMRAEAAQKVRLDVAPFYRTITVNFMNRSGKFAKPDADQFQNALEFAEASRLDRTCAIFETLHANPANQTNVSLLYNMGVCQEVLVPEDLSAALPYYAKADQLLTRPDKLVSDAFVRTRNAVEASRGTRR